MRAQLESLSRVSIADLSQLGMQSLMTLGDYVSDLKPQPEPPYNPFEHRRKKHPNSVIGSIAHLLKACLGSGILAMPAAFKNAGILVGTVGVILTGIVCTHTVHVLVRTSQEACVVAKRPSMSFAETCGASFAFGPKRFRHWGSSIKKLVDVCMVMCYVSLLCVYVVFIATSLKDVFDVYTPGEELSVQFYCAAVLLPLVLICQIRKLKYLVPFSIMADVGIFIVFIITLYYIFIDLPPISSREAVAPISKWPLFFSTVVFAMEGIGVVMPIENDMAQPERFLGWTGVLNISMTIVILLYGIFGFFGYIQYGYDVKGSITLNLPKSDIITKLLMAIVIYLSFTIQFYVPMEAINRMLKKRQAQTHKKKIQFAIRTLIVCFSVIVAALFPDLELVISLVGAVFFSTFGLLFPAIVETLFRWDRNLGWCNYILWKNIIIGCISILALVSGTYASITKMINEFYDEHGELDFIDKLNYTSLFDLFGIDTASLPIL